MSRTTLDFEADQQKLQEAIDARIAQKEAAKKKRSKRSQAAANKKFYLKRKREAKQSEDKQARAQAAAEERERRLASTVEARAQAELARRELARRFLLPFIHRFMPGYRAGWFHKDLCSRLEKFSQAVTEERSPRLMLSVPPRHGKSITVSQFFPPWHLGRNPSHEFISTSYAESLQTDFSKKAQETIRDPEFQILFPGVHIPRNHESVSRWQLATMRDGVSRLSGGGMLAAGVGGPLTGRGAHVGLIDDPIKNAEEADSEHIRRAVWDWYSSTFYTRLAPGAGILLVCTRWHDDDLSGRAQRQMEDAIKKELETGEWPEDVDRWEIVSYPAIATEDEGHRKKGDALHPERYDLKALRRIKKTLETRHWSALYQQNPVPDTGDFFTKDTIRYYKPGAHPPLPKLDIYCAGDLAISKREKADYTVFVVGGLDEHDHLWILDVRRDRMDSAEIIDEIIDIYKTWKPVRIGLEQDKVAKAIGPMLNSRIKKEELWSLSVEELAIGNRDKRLRAQPIRGRMKQGMVHIPEGALWTEQFVNEHLRFDAGVHDDCVDAHAWLGQLLGGVNYRRRPSKKKKESWKDKLKAATKGGGYMKA